jgi:hypothetical protein
MKKKASPSTRLFLLIIFISFVILIIVEEIPVFNVHPHWRMFAVETAFAGIISSTIGLTIDRYQRQEFSKLVTDERIELKRDVFLYAYGFSLHEHIRDEIRQGILDSSFQRRDLEITWVFSPMPGRQDYLLLTKQHDFILENITAQDQTFSFQVNQITASEKEVLIANELECVKERRTGGKEVTYGPSDMKQVADSTDPHVKKVMLSKSFEIGPSEKVEFYYVMKEVRRAYADESYGCRHPIVGKTNIKIQVNPPLALDVSVACKGKSLKTLAQHSPPGLYALYLDEGLLPHQGISISWSPRPDVPAASNAGTSPASDKETASSGHTDSTPNIPAKPTVPEAKPAGPAVIAEPSKPEIK